MYIKVAVYIRKSGTREYEKASPRANYPSGTIFYLRSPLSKLGFELNFLNWIIESHYCFYAGARPVRGTRWDGSGSKENGTVRLGCDYGRTMRVWVLLPSFLNSVRRKSKNPRESGRPELRSRESRKMKTSAFKASLSRRWASPISRLSSS